MSVELPTVLEIAPDGQMVGASRTYVKHLADLKGLYRDGDAFGALMDDQGPDAVAYVVHEQRYESVPGNLITGTSTLYPGLVAEEFAMTRGHLHAIADRAELYHCLSGRGVMLLDSTAGDSIAVELTPGKAVNIPGRWVHRSVNVGDQPFVTLFCYSADSGQDYSIIERAGGMKSLIVRAGQGWRQIPNPDHRGYSTRAY